MEAFEEVNGRKSKSSGPRRNDARRERETGKWKRNAPQQHPVVRFPVRDNRRRADTPAPSDVHALFVLHPDGAEAVIRGFQCECSVKP